MPSHLTYLLTLSSPQIHHNIIIQISFISSTKYTRVPTNTRTRPTTHLLLTTSPFACPFRRPPPLPHRPRARLGFRFLSPALLAAPPQALAPPPLRPAPLCLRASFCPPHAQFHPNALRIRARHALSQIQHEPKESRVCPFESCWMMDVLTRKEGREGNIPVRFDGWTKRTV